MAKLSSGTVLGMFDQHWNFQAAEDSLTTQGKDNRTYVGLPLVYDASIKDYYRDLGPLNLNNGFGITVNAKNPERIIKFLDALMTEDWQKTFSWGFVEEDYIVNENGRFMKTQEQRDKFSDATWKLANKADTLFKFLPKTEGSFSDGNSTDGAAQPEEYQAGLKDFDKEVLAAYGFNSYVDFFSEPPANQIYYPAWSIDLVDGSDAKIANTKLNELSSKFLPKAILAKPADFEQVWNDYTAEIGNTNVKAYEDRINTIIQQRIKDWSK